MTLTDKIEKLNRKYKMHLENAYNLKYTDPGLSDYSEFKANYIEAKLKCISRFSA